MTAVTVKPMKLPSKLRIEGYVLDYHSISSTPTGDPYHPFDTKHTELGELLYRFKYRRGGNAVLADIIDTVEQFIAGWKPPINCIVPAPPSLARNTQPAVELARGLATRLQIPAYEDAVIKIKATPQMKNIDDWSERQRLLGEAVQVGDTDLQGKSVLLIDDLIESGSTIRRAGEVLLKDGGARALYALVLTRTK
jgi:predicted amidophosphoribosyltransferase